MLYTIGHSTHSEEHFARLLTMHGVTAVCDVRSMPYSRFNPQFNREEFKDSLLERGVAYVYLGREFGARSEDPSCYDNGKVRYDSLAGTALFQYGVSRLRDGLRKYRIALMCAEKEPLECHRTILVARNLLRLGLPVQHIHADGSLESHAAAERRLAAMFHLEGSDLFRTTQERIADAYKLQEERIAFAVQAEAEEEVLAFRSAAG